MSEEGISFSRVAQGCPELIMLAIHGNTLELSESFLSIGVVRGGY